MYGSLQAKVNGRTWGKLYLQKSYEKHNFRKCIKNVDNFCLFVICGLLYRRLRVELNQKNLGRSCIYISVKKIRIFVKCKIDIRKLSAQILQVFALF